MNIQQNVNQTLSLASFIYSQTPMAAARKEKQAFDEETKRMGLKAGKLVEAAEQAQEEIHPQGRKNPTITGERLNEEEERVAKMYRDAADLTQSVYERSPGQPKYGEVMALREKGRSFEARVERRKKAKRAEEDRAAATELERQRQLGPKGISREAVESRLWNREDKK